MSKKGYRKCSQCFIVGKHKYKKGSRVFCSPECKQDYLNNNLPTLIKDIQKEFNRLVAKDQSCAKCSQRFDVMQCSHVWSIGHSPGIRFDILNALPMCGHCHNYWWHLEPMESRTWFENKYPDRVAYLDFAKVQNKRWMVGELHQIRKDIENRNFNGLIRFLPEYKLLLDKVK